MEIRPYEYSMSVCKVADYSRVNPEDAFVFIGRTDEELFALVAESWRQIK
ncbi:hypothetical protein [Faecalispora jeddahensis]|nr:hypothetical protein [Faecalispora jeddahensis]